MSYALNNYQIAFLVPPNAQNSPRGGILANIFFNFEVLMNIILNETPNVQCPVPKSMSMTVLPGKMRKKVVMAAP